ncbi:SMI1/KNR4 family protein SUKH-1 [Flavobacterium sp. 270]|uniref:SMI1/KNR4 family protein n=1 Tax=Flavobacterium sp. 270 TaxID=2512114 RepID=UPI00106704AF|nr:SMI1/KNR4 family protein [Flavobacterium sp. 270]TDW52247.1 SMI1/KNR4 family protein SUKH-1 [Flavobacterium sp. 270]
MEKLNQIERIKKKLILAKEADKDLKVFGAGSHNYIVGEIVNHDDIVKFENDYAVSLPESYKAFLLHIGNGGVSYGSSCAGPFYGIYPLGKNTNELFDETYYLKANCILYPKMSDEYWESLIQAIDEEDISDEDYEKELGKIFSGILPLGSQGCSYIHGLVLNGEYKGKVVNIDIDRQKPKFAFEATFLDWYERWLDEVISGDLIIDTPSWFGYGMGGSSKDLLETYSSTVEFEVKKDCLYAILKKADLDIEILNLIEEQYQTSSGELKEIFLQILTKFDYDRAHNYLTEYTRENLLAVFQFVFWYAKDKSADWLEVIKKNISRIDDDETFSFCTYLLKEMDIDYSSVIIPFTSHENEKIRITTYYSLGLLKNKHDHLEVFIQGLNDNVNRVIHITLQALKGMKDKKLLIHYKNIAERFPKEQDYILVNLNHRLEEFGLSTATIKNLNIDNFKMSNIKKKWYEFWKK